MHRLERRFLSKILRSIAYIERDHNCECSWLETVVWESSYTTGLSRMWMRWTQALRHSHWVCMICDLQNLRYPTLPPRSPPKPGLPFSFWPKINPPSSPPPFSFSINVLIFGAIERLNSLRALTPLLCQSHRDKCFWNFMSSLYIVLFCNFYVTIWCKDNKLIIYLLKFKLALG